MSQAIQQPVHDANEIADAMALRQMLSGYWLSQSIYIVAKIGVADLLSGGPQSSEELASSLRVDPGALYRIMRTLAGYGLFTEGDNHRFGLTPLGSLLQTGVPGSMRGLAIWNGEPPYRAWGAVQHTIETGQPALGHVLGMKLFDYLAQNHETGRVFDEAMSGLCVQVSLAVVAAYNFSGVKKLVDVGGGQGTLVAAILKSYPEMEATLFDRSAGFEEARKQLEAAGVAGRCEVVVGDFFESVPAGADCYLLSSVIHDWNDEQSLRILRQCRTAMDPGNRLLLVECLIPDSPAPVFSELLDLQMLIMTGGRERTEPQFEALLATAGFRLLKVIPTAVPECIIEAVAV